MSLAHLFVDHGDAASVLSVTSSTSGTFRPATREWVLRDEYDRLVELMVNGYGPMAVRRWERSGSCRIRAATRSRVRENGDGPCVGADPGIHVLRVGNIVGVGAHT
jgi:hypothetical protein